MSESPHGAGELAHAHLFGSALKASNMTDNFGIPDSQLQSESGGLGMDAVSAPDHGRVFKFMGAAFKGVAKVMQVFQNDLRGCFDLQGLGGIHHVIGGEAVMQPARLGADFFRYRGSKGDDIMFYFSFNLLDALQSEVAALGNSAGGIR